MANVARSSSLRWNCFGTLLTAILVSTQLIQPSSSAVSRGEDGVVCSPASERGQCLQSMSSRPGCAAGAETREDCRNNAGDPASLYNPGYVDHPGSGYCNNSPANGQFPTHTVARELTVILYPIGVYKKFSLYVSWKTTNTDPNTVGFYIWSYKCSRPCWLQNTTAFPSFAKDLSECLLIDDPNARSILFNGAAHKSGLFQCKDGNWDIREKCNSDHIMTVMVVPWPRSSGTTFSGLLASSSLTFAWEQLWMDCWPTLYSASCSSPVVIQPVEYFNLTAMPGPDRGMAVHVTWPCSDGDVEYIVTVTDPLVNPAPNCTTPGQNPPCFVARNTTQVTIGGLELNREYSISVQVMPKCNGTSFAEHYVGCRSEVCCQAKRITLLGSGTSSGLPSASFKPSSVNVESSCINIRSSGVRSESASTRNLLTPSSVGIGASATVTVPAASSRTLAPPFEKQGETGRVGRTGTVVGVALAVVLVAFFVASSIILISYWARRRLRSGGSLTSGSSLTESLETLEAGGEGTGYCHLMTLDHAVDTTTSAYPVTTNGTTIGGEVLPALESPEGTASQTTMEVGSMAGVSGATSESEKISGVSMSLDDNDAFESSSERSSGEGDVTQEKEACPAGGSNGFPKLAPPKRLFERSRSESVRAKRARSDSSSSYRKRPRSLSSSQQPEASSPPSALILYSKSSPELEQRAIQQLLVSDLTQYNVRTVSEDTSMPRECPASWLEAQTREVSAVFCVCNEAFHHEWENWTDGLTSLVPVFKQLCHGLVTPSYGRNQQLWDKVAIVLLHRSDSQYIPSYLNSRRRFVLLPNQEPNSEPNPDLKPLARFAANLPEYIT